MRLGVAEKLGMETANAINKAVKDCFTTCIPTPGLAMTFAMYLVRHVCAQLRVVENDYASKHVQPLVTVLLSLALVN